MALEDEVMGEQRDARGGSALRAVALAILAAAVLTMVFHYVVGPARSDAVDFRPTWEAGRAIRDGHSIYEVPLFVSTPLLALLGLPLSFLPFGLAAKLWLAFNLGATAVAGTLLWKRLTIRKDLLVLGVVLLVAAFFRPLASSLDLGQPNVLALVLVLFALQALREDRDVPAGVLIGIAAVLKPIPALLVPYLLLRKRFRAALAAVGAAVAAIAVCIPIVGWDAVRRFFDGVVPFLAGGQRSLEFGVPPGIQFENDQSLLGVLRRLLPDSRSTAETLWIAGSIVLAAVVIWVLVRHPSQDLLIETGMVLALTVAVAPISRTHYAVLLLPGFVGAVNAIGDRARGWLIPVGLGVAWYLSGTYDSWTSGGLSATLNVLGGGLTLYGAVILLFVLAAISRERNRSPRVSAEAL